MYMYNIIDGWSVFLYGSIGVFFSLTLLLLYIAESLVI